MPQFVILRNLNGWIDTEHLDRVYVNTESWNNVSVNPTSSVNFGVEYNRQSGIWSGRGWNETVGWIDFSYDQINHLAQFEIPPTDPEAWGSWNGEVDLSAVSYSAQSGVFEGLGFDSHIDTGGVFDSSEDDAVGSGQWTFANLEFTGSECPENVNLFLSGTPFLHSTTCDIDNLDIDIQWSSENVTNCNSTIGPWNNNGFSQYTGTTNHPTADITDINTPVLFKLECIGDYSGNSVEGVAVASCGTALPAGCESAEDCPLEIIKPILIET